MPKKDQKSKEGTEETLIKAVEADDTKVSKLLFSLLLLKDEFYTILLFII